MDFTLKQHLYGFGDSELGIGHTSYVVGLSFLRYTLQLKWYFRDALSYQKGLNLYSDQGSDMKRPSTGL